MCLVLGAGVLSLKWMTLPPTQMQKQGLGFEFQICCASKRSRGKNEDAQNSAQDHTKTTEQNPAFDLFSFSTHSFLYCCQSQKLGKEVSHIFNFFSFCFCRYFLIGSPISWRTESRTNNVRRFIWLMPELFSFKRNKPASWKPQSSLNY